MTTIYFRITVYHPTEDISAIFDSNGMFEKLWQLSSFMIQKGFKVLEISSGEKFLDVDIIPSGIEVNKIILRSCQKGMPQNITYNLNGITYPAVKISNKTYIPDKTKLGLYN